MTLALLLTLNGTELDGEWNLTVYFQANLKTYMAPTWTGKWENIFQSGKSPGIFNRLKSQGFLPQILETLGILASFYIYFFSDFLIEVYLLNTC